MLSPQRTDDGIVVFTSLVVWRTDNNNLPALAQPLSDASRSLATSLLSLPRGAFAQDAFAQDAFAQDAFAQDAFAQDAFAQDAFAQDAFAQDFPGSGLPRLRLEWAGSFAQDSLAPDLLAQDGASWLSGTRTSGPCSRSLTYPVDGGRYSPFYAAPATLGGGASSGGNSPLTRGRGGELLGRRVEHVVELVGLGGLWRESIVPRVHITALPARWPADRAG